MFLLCLPTIHSRPWSAIDDVADILEPDWEADSGEEDNGMELDGASLGTSWHLLPLKVMEIEVPTPWLNARTGSVELKLGKFEYSYQAKV